MASTGRNSSAEHPPELFSSLQLLPGAEPWKEAKVGVVYRNEARMKSGRRGFIEQARYVADGTPWVWNVAESLCPEAV